MLIHWRKKKPGRRAKERLFTADQVKACALIALKRMNPASLLRNPVMLIVWTAAVIVTVLAFRELVAPTPSMPGRISEAAFAFSLAGWLWAIIWAGNFSEALAEARGQAEALELRAMRSSVTAKRMKRPDSPHSFDPVPAEALRKGDYVVLEPGDAVPADAEVTEGTAAVEESAVTGESAPVTKSPAAGENLLTGGTRVLSDRLVARIAADPGKSFLDRMIGLVDGSRRRRTPNEVALTIMLTAMSVILLLSCATLVPFSAYAVGTGGHGVPVRVITAVAFLVCVIPTTIAGLLSTIGVAGMARMMKANVIAMSARAVEAAGDVDILLLDKTGTVTVGSREAIAFVPGKGVTVQELAELSAAASIADETPEGYSIVRLARDRYGVSLDVNAYRGSKFVAFSAQTRMSGIDFGGHRIRKGAASAVEAWLESAGARIPDEIREKANEAARRGSTPLVVADGARALGVVELKDVVKPGLKDRFRRLRAMGIRPVMVTGDNRYTAAAIAQDAGIEDYVGDATPEEKLEIIRRFQDEGKLVAMSGDGTNDAPALAQADVAVAMESGTQPAKEAANMIDLDSSPTKLLEIIEIGRQMVLTRGAITTFAVSNVIAEYFAVIPAAFAETYPELGLLNFLGLASPVSAVLSTVIFSALVMLLLIPLAIRGVKAAGLSPMKLLQRNILIYGAGGLLVPLVMIKAIDLILFHLGLY